VTVEHALELLAAPVTIANSASTTRRRDNIPKAGRYGPYVQIGEMTNPKQKPKTASLFSTMSPETLTFEEASKLLYCRAWWATTRRRRNRSSPNGR